MMKPVIGAAMISLLGIAPVLAIAPNCEDQLAQLRAQISQTPAAKGSLENKYNEAQRLCSQNKDEEAQQLAREIREDLAGKSVSDPTSSGSSLPKSDASPRK